MSQRYITLIVILLLLAGAIWIDLPDNSGIHLGDFNRDLETVLGLDLRGGMQVLLEVDLPEESDVDAQALQDARTILENRSNGLGVSEVVFQVAGNRRILGEFPGLTNTEEVIAVLKETGQLEFVDLGETYLEQGTVIKTDQGLSTDATLLPEVETLGGDEQPQDLENKIWTTVMTGDQLKSVGVSTNQIGQYTIQFELKSDGTEVFADYTANNVGNFLAIVLDKVVISAPRVNGVIPDGSGEITGDFSYDTANNLAIQLRYGSLPIPLKVVESRIVGPTLGQDSLDKSLLAGIIGFIIVALFMALYYRLPGFIAILSLIFYALITLALFKFIPVTLTLPAIAGFLLSTGGALDANILTFERLKEELRNGRTLPQAIDLGWKRAWPSIRDSNIATLITSAILFWFGSAYGATFIKGFALTLALGVVVSLFSAIVVTRTGLSVAIDLLRNPSKRLNWFGL
jgi:preprotein translocase subunit SecD